MSPPFTVLLNLVETHTCYVILSKERNKINFTLIAYQEFVQLFNTWQPHLQEPGLDEVQAVARRNPHPHPRGEAN